MPVSLELSSNNNHEVLIGIPVSLELSPNNNDEVLIGMPVSLELSPNNNHEVLIGMPVSLELSPNNNQIIYWFKLTQSALILECLLFGLKNRGLLIILLPDVSPASKQTPAYPFWMY